MYAAAGKRNEPKKFEIAERIVAEGSFGISSQVLAEFYVIFSQKSAIKPSPQEVDDWIDALTQFPTVAIDDALVRTGILIARRYQIHYYDAAIVAAAERLGASVLYTEDLNHGQRYGSVLVENPFRHL